MIQSRDKPQMWVIIILIAISMFFAPAAIFAARGGHGGGGMGRAGGSGFRGGARPGISGRSFSGQSSGSRMQSRPSGSFSYGHRYSSPQYRMPSSSFRPSNIPRTRNIAPGRNISPNTTYRSPRPSMRTPNYQARPSSPGAGQGRGINTPRSMGNQGQYRQPGYGNRQYQQPRTIQPSGGINSQKYSTPGNRNRGNTGQSGNVPTGSGRNTGQGARQQRQTPANVPGHGGGQYGPDHGGQKPGYGPNHGYGPNYGQGGHHHDYYNQPQNINGYFFYGAPGFYGAFNYGYWGLGISYGCYAPDCYYSPFYYYGFPYVYAPRVEVVDVPVYTYTAVPQYTYGNDYYLSPGNYTGLNAVIGNIADAWNSNNPNLLLQYVGDNTDVGIYMNGSYSYSLPGTDYQAMIKDAMNRIRTVDFNVYNIQKRSDGAYVIYAKHELYDAENNHKVVYVTYTLNQTDNGWAIVDTGSSENKLG